MAERAGHGARAAEAGVIDLKDLVRALDQRRVADWTVIQRDEELAVLDETAPRLRRAERRTRWQLTVHVDSADGRGSARVALDGSAEDAGDVVARAAALARASLGSAWQSAPPSAPARVRLTDDALASAEPLAAADGIVRGLKRPGRLAVTATVAVAREQVHAASRDGLRATWLAALARADVLVASAAHSLAITREVRQLADLDLDAALAAAPAELDAIAQASAPTPGPCTLVLATDALLHGGLGVWEAFAHQADAAVERAGLTRYRERMPIAPGADHVHEPLTIASDGALDYATRSAPLGDDGDAVRRFTLVERGIAVGLGLSPREAALRNRDPNGGVRNLVVAAGSWSGAAGDAGPDRVVEIRRLRALAIDPFTGDASLEIALGFAGGKPFTGGTVRLDLIDALARAHRSRTRIRRGAYDGPAAVWIEHAELIP
ncbi:MAG TPA: metallopeptidase TldD-related protein [Kofleriaceae bacterium]|nr:metallopeptidase TldD-related protein [Kofleriaceae bacterium]